MDNRFWTMFSLLALTSLCLIYIGFRFYHLNYINDTQLGYAGAILGGSMTLIGVWWTIDNQEKQKREELELTYQPILSCNIVPYKEMNQLCSELTLLFNHIGFNDSNHETIPYMLEFKNTGRGEIRTFHANIKSCTIISSPFNDDNQIDLSKSYMLGDGFLNFFPINGSQYILIRIPKQIQTYTPIPTEYIRIEVCLSSFISGFISETEHEYYINFYIDIYLDGRNERVEIDSLTVGYLGSKKVKKIVHHVG